MSDLFGGLEPSFAPRHVEVPSQESDDWFTPLPRWRRLDQCYDYDCDCDAFGHLDAPVTRAILAKVTPDLGEIGIAYTIERSVLGELLTGRRVWCNCPYSTPLLGMAIEWVWRLFAVEDLGPALLTMELPLTKAEQPAWQKFVEPYRDCGPFQAPGPTPWQWTLSSRVLAKRQRYGHPLDPTGARGDCASFPTVLLHWRRNRVGSWPGGDGLRSLELGS